MNKECNQGRTCKTIVRALETEYDDHDFEFKDSLFGQWGMVLAALFAAFGVFLILLGATGYLLSR
jgi:hypothetical protein